jgi:hypothetical protein
MSCGNLQMVRDEKVFNILTTLIWTLVGVGYAGLLPVLPRNLGQFASAAPIVSSSFLT